MVKHKDVSHWLSILGWDAFSFTKLYYLAVSQKSVPVPTNANL